MYKTIFSVVTFLKWLVVYWRLTFFYQNATPTEQNKIRYK